MQLVYRGIHYKLDSSAPMEVPVETPVGQYRGAMLRFGKPLQRVQSEAIVVLRYRLFWSYGYKQT
jgi:hypothetical protein